MKKSKKTKKGMFRHKWLLSLSAAVSLLILGSLIYYTTVSLLKDQDNVRNDFAIADLKAEVIEKEWEDLTEFNNDTVYPKKVTIKNTGTQPILVRVALLPLMELAPDPEKEPDETDPLILPTPLTGDDALLKFLPDTAQLMENKWLDGGDGFYYYLDKIPVGQESLEVLESVELLKEKMDAALVEAYEIAEFKIDIKVEAIGLTRMAYRDAFWQGKAPTADPLKQVDTAWKALTVGEDTSDLDADRLVQK